MMKTSFAAFLEEVREIELDATDPRHPPEHIANFLMLLLIQTLLGEDLKPWRAHLEQLRHSQTSVREGRPRLIAFLRVLLAAELLGDPSEAELGLAWEELPKAIEMDGRHPYAGPLLADAALALAMLRGKAEEIRAARQHRMTLPGVGNRHIFTVELLYESALLIDRRMFADSFRLEAAHCAWRTLAGATDLLEQSLAGMTASARAAGSSLPQLLHGAAHEMDRDLFPNGPEAPARLEVGDPSLKIARQRGADPYLEIRLPVTGSGGAISCAGPVLEPITYGTPGTFERLLTGEARVASVRGARSRKDILSILKHRGQGIKAIADLSGDIELNDPIVAPYRERLSVGLDWVRARYPDFQASAELVVENPRA